jgi:hypothetical protein
MVTDQITNGNHDADLCVVCRNAYMFTKKSKFLFPRATPSYKTNYAI